MRVIIDTKKGESKIFEDVKNVEKPDDEVIVHAYIGEHATKAHRFEGGEVVDVHE